MKCIILKETVSERGIFVSSGISNGEHRAARCAFRSHHGVVEKATNWNKEIEGIQSETTFGTSRKQRKHSSHVLARSAADATSGSLF